MNIYLLTRTEKRVFASFDAAIVCANTQDEAKRIHPASLRWSADEDGFFNETAPLTWANHVDYVKAELIGTASDDFKEPCLILATYNES